MKAATWLRLLAAIMIFFAFGHTIGVLNPPAEGAAGRALDAMRRTRFPIMGSREATATSTVGLVLREP